LPFPALDRAQRRARRVLVDELAGALFDFGIARAERLVLFLDRDRLFIVARERRDRRRGDGRVRVQLDVERVLTVSRHGRTAGGLDQRDDGNQGSGTKGHVIYSGKFDALLLLLLLLRWRLVLPFQLHAFGRLAHLLAA